MLRREKSLTARLTLLFATVSSSVLLILGLVIAKLVEHHFEDMDLELLEGKLELIQHSVITARSVGNFDGLPAQLDAALVGEHGLAVGIWTSDGKQLYLSERADFPQRNLPPKPHSALPGTWQGKGGQHFRGISGLAPTGVEGESPATVLLSTSLTHHDHFMYSFRLTMWAVVIIAALITGFLGWLAARRGLAPLRNISSHASDITANSLDQRIEAGEIPVEVAELVNTLNEMLSRLKESFDRLSDFSSDIAHELRTPVSNLLTQTQVMLSRARSAEEYQDVLASNAEELERLSRTIADMLFLAKADNHLLVPNQEPVDLEAEISSLLEFYEPLIDEKQLHLMLNGHARVDGDRLMLRRAVGNLLSNAIRHTPEHGYINIALQIAGETVSVCIANSGQVIPAEHLPRLFDRFYRADSSRQRTGEGAGLGLAITKSIALAHHGSVSVSTDDGITTFKLVLPARGSKSNL